VQNAIQLHIDMVGFTNVIREAAASGKLVGQRVIHQSNADKQLVATKLHSTTSISTKPTITQSKTTEKVHNNAANFDSHSPCAGAAQRYQRLGMTVCLLDILNAF
jgi:hypothetical protein